MLDEAKRLIADGADVNATPFPNGYAALHCAVLEGHVDVVKLLVDHGANVNAETRDFAVEGRQVKPFTPLQMAITQGSPDVSVALVEGGADVNTVDEDGNSPLHSAFGSFGETDLLGVVIALTGKGADINRANVKGESPLHRSAMYEKMDVAQLLIERGANINAEDADGNTPLFVCAGAWNVQMVASLVEHGANINAVNGMRQTPLHYMFRNLQYTSSLSMHLKAKGAQSVSYRDTADRLLNCPEVRGIADAAKLLVKEGAKPNERDSEGKTPLDYVAKGTLLESMLLGQGFAKAR